MKTALGFIGVGDLALYTIRGLRRGGYGERILLGPRNRQKAEYLRQNCDCEIAADNQDVVSGSDCIVLATRPADCLAALAGLEFRPGQLLLSVVAGIGIERLRGEIPQTVEIVRAMPVSAAEVGASPTLVYPSNPFVERLFDHCGNSIVLAAEGQFDQGTILACVYSWYFALFESLIQATGGPELPADIAARLVMGMARGAAELALADPAHSPGEIAERIATDGTYSRLGLDLLDDAGAFAPWRDACALLRERLAQT